MLILSVESIKRKLLRGHMVDLDVETLSLDDLDAKVEMI
jgi:hypothetical protein